MAVGLGGMNRAMKAQQDNFLKYTPHEFLKTLNRNTDQAIVFRLPVNIKQEAALKKQLLLFYIFRQLLPFFCQADNYFVIRASSRHCSWRSVFTFAHCYHKPRYSHGFYHIF